MDPKIIFAIFSTLFLVFSFLPYLFDVFKHKTRPHIYTWLVWSITQGTATAGLLYGGGDWGGASFVAGTVLVFAVFIASLRYGTKNITKWDTVVLVAALSAIIVWWRLDSPLTAVIMVSVIDAVGYIPSFRKSFSDPWGETLLSWCGFTLGNLFAIAALAEYNFLTLTYIITISVLNISLVIFCKIRRKYIVRPNSIS